MSVSKITTVREAMLDTSPEAVDRATKVLNDALSGKHAADWTEDQLTNGLFVPMPATLQEHAMVTPKAEAETVERIVFEIPPKDTRVFTTDGRHVGDIRKAEIEKEIGGKFSVILRMDFHIDPVSKKIRPPDNVVSDPDADETAALDLGAEFDA